MSTQQEHEYVFKTYAGKRLVELVAQRTADPVLARDAEVVNQVLPFKVNSYVVDNLIDWERAPDDPMYRLVFPHRDMLEPEMFDEVERALDDPPRLRAVVAAARAELNPHPSGQLTQNIPENQEGLQHKYRETVLAFPRQGQTCHAYCGYCFRWAQFIGDRELKMAIPDAQRLHQYLYAHPEVTDVLLTGGDPLVMRTEKLAEYVDPLLRPELEHVRTIRIGTKALAYHPGRVTDGEDGAALLALIERIRLAGKHVAVMMHVSHPRELETPVAQRAVRMLASAGAELRSQAPLIKHVNDRAEDWARLWTTGLRLGIHPYYMFIERDTGARRYFGVPIARAQEIYRDAITTVSGLGRTARGPVMSATPGKVVIDGVVELAEGKAFALRFLQAREPELAFQPFYARFDPAAQWWSDLRPMTRRDEPFFASEQAERRELVELAGVR